MPFLCENECYLFNWMFHWSCSVNSMSYHCIVFSIWYFFFLFISLQTVYTQDLCVYFIYCVVLRRHTTVALELTHGFLWGSCCSIFNVMFSLFWFHYWFFLLMYCLSLDLRLLITPLVASTDMENQMIKRLLNT